MTTTVSHPPLFSQKEKVSAREVRLKIKDLLRKAGAPERVVAQGLALGETYFSRMKNRRSGFYRRDSLYPLERLSRVLEFASTTLSPKGVREWFLEPNPSLNNVPPILCLRSNEETEKVVSLLAAIRYGLPA
jgi:uncharacterized protein (DUF2384 family)